MLLLVLLLQAGSYITQTRMANLGLYTAPLVTRNSLALMSLDIDDADFWAKTFFFTAPFSGGLCVCVCVPVCLSVCLADTFVFQIE